MSSHLAPLTKSSLLSRAPSINQCNQKLVSHNPTGDYYSDSSISPFLDGRSFMAQYYSDGRVLDTQLETLHESSDPTAHNRPPSVLTVDNSSINTLLSTSSGPTQKEHDIFVAPAGQAIAFSSDFAESSPHGSPPARARSISGPHPIIRFHSVIDNYSRPRAAPQPPNVTRFRSYTGVSRSQSRWLEKERQSQLTSHQKQQGSLQREPRLAQQQLHRHQLNSRPTIASIQQVFPRKLQLLAIPPIEASSEGPPLDALRRPSSLCDAHRELDTISRPTSNSSRRGTLRLRGLQAVTDPSNPPDLNVRVVQNVSSLRSPDQRSKHWASTENIRSVSTYCQPNASQEILPPVPNISSPPLSINPRPRRLTLKAFLESKPSLESLTTSGQQKQSVPQDPVPANSHRLSMHPLALKRKSTVKVVEAEKPPTAQILIRKELPEDLIKSLELLVGYDELRLLVPIDKLLFQSTDSIPEGADTGKPSQDMSHSHRKSTSNGLFGRFGWKYKKTIAPMLSVRNRQSNEGSNNDRRATFGFWGGGSISPASVFGCPLEDTDPFCCVTVIGGQKHLIPTVMFCLIEEIYVRGMETPGLMRIPGKVELVDSLAQHFERPPNYGDGIDLVYEDIHVLCCLFKRYLRSLPDPIMPRDLFHILWSHCVRQRKGRHEGNLQNQIVTAQCLIRLMPARSFSLMIYVVAFLAQIPLFPRNQFSPIGIAKIFGPALFGTRTQRNAALDERPIQALHWMLENWNMLTDGLLDEHFNPKIDSLPPSDTHSARYPFQPTLFPPSPDAPMQQQDVTPSDSRLSLACSTIEPSSSAGSRTNFTPFKSLRGHQPHSLRRDSLRSARYIVDCYEAQEKTTLDGRSPSFGVNGIEPRNEKDGTARPDSLVAPEALNRQTQQLEQLGSLMAEMTTTHAQASHLPQVPEIPIVDNLTDQGLHCRNLTKSSRPQLLILNEPQDPPPAFVKDNAIELVAALSTSNCPLKTNMHTVQPDNAAANVANEARITSSSAGALGLSGIFAAEKLHPHFDNERSRRIVQKSIEIVDKHQQLLLELKELHSLLTQDWRSTQYSST